MKKLVSCIMALSIILGTLFTGMSLGVSAAKFEQVLDTDPVAEEQHYPITQYDPVANYKGYGNRVSEYEKASITKDGVDGSYALKIEGEGREVSTYLLIGTGAETLTPNTEYTIEMKIKRNINFDEGDYGDEVPFVDFGVNTAWTDQFGMAEFTETGVFETFSHTFTPVLNESGKTGWCHIGLNYYLPVGAEIYIDDINLYATGAEDVNIYNLQRELKGCNLGSFDWITTTPVEETTLTDSVFTVNTLSDYGITAAYASIEEGKGVNGSAALEIGPTSGKKNFFTEFAKEGTKYGGDTSDSFYQGKTVRVAFKAKKVGTVSDFSIKFYKSGSWKTHVLVATELTNDWVRYEADITFSSYDMYLSGTSYRGGHNRIVFESNVAADSCVYIDDIEVRVQADSFAENHYALGSFDTFQYANTPVTSTALEGVIYAPYNMSSYVMTDEFTDTGYGDTRAVEDGDVVISDAGEGFNGSYALKVKGKGVAKEFALSMGKDSLKPTTKYMIKLKAKVTAEKACTQLSVGISDRWQWISNKYANWAFEMSDEAGLANIGTDWREITAYITTSDKVQGYYRRVHLLVNAAEGSTVYIDDIEVYEVGGTGENLFSQGSFGRVNSVAAIDAGDEEANFVYKYINDWTINADTNPTGNGFEAKAMPTSLALTGKHALAVGFNPQNTISGRVWFELTGVDTGKTYKVKFSTLVVGDLTKLRINMKDGLSATTADGKTPTVTLLERTPSFTATSGESKPYQKLSSEGWQTYEFTFTDEFDSSVGFTWPGMEIYITGNANSGVLIDDVSVYEIDGTDEEKPNLFDSQGFEKEAVEPADFSSNKFYSNNDPADMSFMQNLPKSIGFYGTNYKDNSDIFNAVLKENSDFAYGNTFLIDSSSIELAEYEAKRALAAGKEIWVALNSRVSKSGAVVADYQTRVAEIANLVQGIAGDAFQGFYFDEPHYNFDSNEKFAEVTKYLRETYKKRVFAMLKHDSFTSANAKVSVTEDAFKYVTDVGYWNYSIAGMTDRVQKFNTVALPNLNENARVWIAPLMGTHVSTDNDGNVTENIDTEEETIQIFNTMIAGVKNDARFGGIMIYSLGDSNGYNLHKLGEDGKAQYNNYRNLLLTVADEFAGKDTFANKFNEDGVLVVNGNETLADCEEIAIYVANSTVTVLDGEEDKGADATLNKTGLTVKIDLLASGGAKEVKVAVVGDANGDGASDIRDFIRMKKLASNNDAPAEELAAAGTTKAVGIKATHLSAFKQILLGK